MDTIARDLIEGMDDSSFCQMLVLIMQNGSGSGLALLYEDWVLARLRLIRRRAVPIFHGTFLTLLRSTFTTQQIYVPDLLLAMNTPTTAGAALAEDGDVLPEVWSAEIDEVFHHGLPQGMHPGWETLRPHYRPLRGDITVITGNPSSYKSGFMHALAINLARDHGWNFSAFNPEHHPLGSLGGWLEESFMGRRLHELEPDEHAWGKEWVTDHFHMIRPAHEVPATLPWLLDVARVQKDRYGADGLILDPWNYINHTFDVREKETDYIGRCLTELKYFADYQGMHVFVIAHPAKPQEKRATTGDYKGKYPPRQPHEIHGSAHWWNKMDFCLSCYRQEGESGLTNIVEVHVQKNRRYDQCGWPGIAVLRYDGRRFYDVGNMTEPAPVPAEHWAERYD
jgi:AAA domain